MKAEEQDLAGALLRPARRVFAEITRPRRAASRSAFRCGSTISPPSPDGGDYLEDLFVLPKSGGGARGGRSWRRWRGAARTRGWAGWTGRCWTGTPRPSASMKRIGAEALDAALRRLSGEALAALAQRP